MYKFTFFSLTFFTLISCSEKRETISPENTGIVEAVYASAVLEPYDYYNVNASASGILEERLVNEGDTVDKGELLFHLTDITSRLNEESARLSLALAKANYEGDGNLLAEVNAEIQTAKLKLLNDSLNFFRQKELFERNVGSKAEYDARELAYNVSKEQYGVLQKRKKRTEKELKTQMKQAQNAVESSNVRSGDYTLSSRMNGLVYAVFKEPGEYVTMQETIAIVGSADEFLVDLSVDEVDIGRIRKDQKVIVKLEAFPNQVFEARVSKIFPKMEDRTQTFRVQAVFDTIPENFYMGLTGEANIVIAEKEKTLVIPRDYLIDGKYVETTEGRKEVKTGLVSMSHVEIISGLSAGDKLFKPE